MAPRPRWTHAEIRQLFELRDKQKLPWKEIGKIMGRKGDVCCTRYCYSEAQDRVKAIRARMHADPNSPPVAPVVEARPRYHHQTDDIILARIAAQGVTAGLLGDPPPGRSALDERNRGAS